MKTKDRILQASLALFNERGENSVTVAQIAQRLGISEGNLWYHFRAKRDLMAALFSQLEERIERNLSRPPGPETENQMEDFTDYSRESFRAMWDYRFLYRHRYDRHDDPELAQRLHSLTERGHRHTERILSEMVRRGLMRATPAEISELTANAWIISRYWLDYLQERHGLAVISEADIEAGLRQLFALYRPYLVDGPPLPQNRGTSTEARVGRA